MITLDELLEEIEDGVSDATYDDPDVSEEDAFHDIAVNQFFRDDISAETKQDLARCYLGWDPEEDADLYQRHRIPLPQA